MDFELKTNSSNKLKIAVAGLGYVGLANAITLARKHQVSAFDIDPVKVALIKERRSPIQDVLLSKVLSTEDLMLSVTINSGEALNGADYVFIATPTDYDTETGAFDTKSIEAIIEQVRHICPKAVVVIRSTIPIGYCDRLSTAYPDLKIAFVPEFLKEGSALEDSLNPSRIVIAPSAQFTEELADIFSEAISDNLTKIFVCTYKEAEAIKLFSNSYLAMRVAFFNEVDTYSRHHGLNVKSVIKGICADDRIGNQYNNPSFGYGGYCLPKDTKQLKASFEGVSESLITAIVNANEVRKKDIASWIVQKTKGTIGIYRLVMKTGSDNMRQSSIIDVADHLQAMGAKTCIFEPLITTTEFKGLQVFNDLEKFKKESALIICNRYDPVLDDVREKTYTPDIFNYS